MDVQSLGKCENHCMEAPNRKAYEKPMVTRLTLEEAKRKLEDHASRGSQDAKNFLAMIFAPEAKKLSTSNKKSA
jgi:hypothetical protein